MLTIDDMIDRFDGSIGYATNSKEICQYIADLLKELKERRKEPEIIKCEDCKWYGRADKRRFYRGMDCLQRRIGTIVPDRDFCSRAEKRHVENG